MFFWLSCLMAGLSLFCLVFVFVSPWRFRGSAASQSRLPLPIRLCWPWLVAVSVVCRPFLSWRTRLKLESQLQVAGLDDLLLPEQLVACQCLLLMTTGFVLSGVLWFSEAPGPGTAVSFLLLIALFAGWPRYWLRETGRRRQQQMLREFPFLLDMATLCVEAGLNLQGALIQASRHGPDGPLRQELRHALADMRAGVGRIDALEQMARRTGLEVVQGLVTSLAQADQLGMSLGPLLRAQSGQRRSERFLRAEKLALEAPVKMLFPMVFCIFPCTFLIIGFPVAVRLFDTAW